MHHSKKCPLQSGWVSFSYLEVPLKPASHFYSQVIVVQYESS